MKNSPPDLVAGALAASIVFAAAARSDETDCGKYALVATESLIREAGCMGYTRTDELRAALDGHDVALARAEVYRLIGAFGPDLVLASLHIAGGHMAETVPARPAGRPVLRVV